MAGETLASTDMEEGFDAPIEHFQFRQMPAEFKLKSCPADMEKPSWSDSLPCRASLLQISHQKGLLFYPHYERGALAFVPIANLAEKDYLPAEAIGFPGDESPITALFCTATYLLVGKKSKKLYLIDLAVENISKKPFVAKIAQNESEVVQIVHWNDCAVALQAEGSIKAFQLPELSVKESLFDEKLKHARVSCVSVCCDAIAFGTCDSNEIFVQSESTCKTLTVPSETGSKGISSLFFSSLSTILCSVVPVSENDYVDLIVIEKPLDTEPRFTRFLDPCASRPPGPNQFYFCGINDWSQEDLKELVLVGNFASPDIGVAGRLNSEDPFGTYFIDVDEGLAQLPLLKANKLTFPVGLALDFTSTMKHENRQDPDAPSFSPAPILWILTSAGQLCPFALLKTNDLGPWPFMKPAAQLQFSPPRPLESSVTAVKPAIQSDAEDSLPSSPAIFRSEPVAVAPSDLSSPQLSSEEEDECTDEVEQALHQQSLLSSPTKQQPPKQQDTILSTPSKMSLSEIASLQRSAEKLPSTAQDYKSASSTFSFSAPSPTKPTETAQTSKPAMPTSLFGSMSPASKASPVPSSGSSASSKAMSIVSQERTIPAPIRKEEVMEPITCNPYKSILLSEVAVAHKAMQDDLHALRQLAYKNSILLRQNTVKYYSTLEALEQYAGNAENLLGSGERVFTALKDKCVALKTSFASIFAEAGRFKRFCEGLKNDSKIDWQQKALQLEQLSEEVTTKIAQLQEILASPAAKRASVATINRLHQSIQERLQLLIIRLSTLLVSPTTASAVGGEQMFGALERMRALCLSTDSLVDEFNAALSINVDDSASRKKRHERLLEIAKSRGARLLIPSEKKLKLKEVAKRAPTMASSIDDQLVDAFISAVKLNDPVPEFRDKAEPVAVSPATTTTAATSVAAPVPAAVQTSKPSALSFFTESKEGHGEVIKPTEQKDAKPFTFTTPTAEEKPIKPFSFTAPTDSKPSSSPVTKASTSTSKPAFSFTPAAESKATLADPKPAFSFTPVAESKPTFSFTPAAESKPTFSFAPVAESKPSFSSSLGSTESKEPNKPTFSFALPATEAKAASPAVSEESKPLVSISSSANESKPAASDSKETTSTFSFSRPPFEITAPAVESKPVTTESKSSVDAKDLKPALSFSDTFSEKSDPAAAAAAAAKKSTDAPFSFSFTKPEQSKHAEEEKKSQSSSAAESSTISVVSVGSPSSDSSLTASEAKKDDVFSFKFDFSSSASTESKSTTPATASTATTTAAEANSAEAEKKPIPGILSFSPPQSTKTEIPALLTAQNAFAPPSLTSPEKPAFSLTTTPVFGQTSMPSTTGFGFPSSALAQQPVFGQASFAAPSSTPSSQPAFGQTTMPSASFMPAVSNTAAAPKPGAFAAFAQTGGQALGFSSFAAPGGGGTGASSGGLSFASFSNSANNANANNNTNSEQGKDKPKPSFNFSGFRG